ncbi:Transmembrane protein [Trichinella pseudospiralis]|uniref:Transmembrane protein 107 n=1 Tax=Trichinella pseudospiralis TaxID=6337 RepID=A0A0V1JLU5_TRIPS|nr:Transmembrane protein [Trichinella pseudospiralis]KRZ19842.1 Transmembrane protein [Trichinella pseudospiralis]KRZ35892.1 Transmembrane protein [Trichinella pseudospiralis]
MRLLMMSMIIQKLIPARFLLMTAHVVITVCIIWSRDMNVIAGLPDKYSPDDYSRKDFEFTIALCLSFACFFVEYVGFLCGISMFIPACAFFCNIDCSLCIHVDFGCLHLRRVVVQRLLVHIGVLLCSASRGRIGSCFENTAAAFCFLDDTLLQLVMQILQCVQVKKGLQSLACNKPYMYRGLNLAAKGRCSPPMLVCFKIVQLHGRCFYIKQDEKHEQK